MSHTPGPWELVETPEEHFGPRFRIYPPAEGESYRPSLMADADYYPSVPSNRADWLLIAAAPELLALLKEAMPCVAGYENDRGAPISENDLSARIQQLIAKAEGK
jgi:hypothetical protein